MNGRGVLSTVWQVVIIPPSLGSAFKRCKELGQQCFPGVWWHQKKMIGGAGTIGRSSSTCWSRSA